MGRAFLKDRQLSSDGLWHPTPHGSPPLSLTEAEKQEQEAAVGRGPTGLQGRLSSLQAHYLWRGATLISSRLGQDPPAPPPPLAPGQCRALWVGSVRDPDGTFSGPCG